MDLGMKEKRKKKKKKSDDDDPFGTGTSEAANGDCIEE